MPLAPGDKLGPYEVVAQLGAGGMGEVYRARDPRLGRDVAIKALPAAFAQDPERLARFEREAKLLASLNHPRIGALYGLEESGSNRVLVLELVEGESLAARLARGRLPVDEALDVATQVAGALEAAHESGVVHRDLKPGNVMLTPSGGVKVLDFGLAKAGAGEAGDASLSASPTMTYAATQHGVILGTAAYMSPEQARGKAVDRRADIWSFGCVLYEMLTGRQAFAGETVSDTLASILKSEPDWNALPATTPPRVSALLRRCLRKDPARRLRDAGDARLELEEARQDGDAPATARAGAGAPRGLAVALGAALALALALAAWALARGHGGAATPLIFTITPPAGIAATTAPEGFAISPDGTTLAFVGTDSTGAGSIWLRDLGALKARPLPGTENATGLFWAPDSRELAFFADGKLKKVSLAGGSPQVLCDAPDPRGGSWGSAGTILFAPAATGPLQAVAADGGTPVVALAPDSARSESGLRFPQFLPDGRSYLFVPMPHPPSGYAVELARLGSARRRPVMVAGAAPVWSSTGDLVTTENGHLVAQPFDPGGGTLRGRPLDLGDAPYVGGHDGCYAVSVSRDGKLAFGSGTLSNTRVVPFDRAGRAGEPLPLPSGRWESLGPSPDGKRMLVSRRTSGTLIDLWLADVGGGPASLFVSGVADGPFAWSPDGREVAFGRAPRGPLSLVVREVDGGAEHVVLPEDGLFKNPYAWTPDSRNVLFAQARPGTGWDLLQVPARGGAVTPVIATPANEYTGLYSWDGRWVLYTSDESGRSEIYARSVTGDGRRIQVTNGGFDVTASSATFDWTHDLREVVVMTGGEARAYALDRGAGMRVAGTRSLFTYPPSAVGTAALPDHQHFYATLPAAGAEQPVIAVRANWRASAPAR